jgi:uncharacterized membrane protein
LFLRAFCGAVFVCFVFLSSFLRAFFCISTCRRTIVVEEANGVVATTQHTPLRLPRLKWKRSFLATQHHAWHSHPDSQNNVPIAVFLLCLVLFVFALVCACLFYLQGRGTLFM